MFGLLFDLSKYHELESNDIYVLENLFGGEGILKYFSRLMYD
jgi:hypothetical protein